MRSLDQTEAGLQAADGEVQPPAGGEFRRAENFAQAFDFGLGGADQMHVEAQADGIQFVAHLGDVAAEALHAFDAQLALRFHRAAGHRRRR